MPTDLSLSVVISQVITHTPSWVWAVLVIITVIGLSQVVARVVTSRRLLIAPVALGAYSLWGAATAFGAHPEVFAGWLVGVALVVAATQALAGPSTAQYLGAGRYAVQGSLWPLACMLSVFVVRYVAAVTLVMHPAWAHDTMFSLVMPMVYGALSGVFLVRSLRILRTAPAVSGLHLA